MTTDPRLGRRYEADPRNNNFPVRALLRRVAYQEPRTWIWNCLKVLDQGQEGSCVGHGFAHEMLTDPYPRKDIGSSDAFNIYRLAQRMDEYPGEDYEGTSVLAGIKAVKEMYRNIESYRWATNIQDIVATLGYFGPIVIGVNWYEGMYDADADGFVHVRGNISGGHCCLLRGVDIKKGAFVLHNSWGESWGKGGAAWISFDDFSRLLREQGEACVIVHNQWWREGENCDDRLQA